MRAKPLSISILVAASLVGNSQATTVFSDNFDGYANQAAFEAVWTPIGTTAPISASLSTAQAVSPVNSVLVGGYTVSSVQMRNRVSFTESGSLSTLSALTFSFDFYDTVGSGSPYRQSANLQDTIAPGSTAQLISMGMNNNQSGTDSGGSYYMGRILGYTVVAGADANGGPNESGTLGAGAYFKLNDFGVGLRSIGWHNLKVTLSSDDGLSTDFAFFVDNVLAERVNNVGTAATFRSYDNMTVGSGNSNGGNPAYFDNFSLDVTPVPEPGTWSLVAMGFGTLLFIRKLRR